MKLSKLFVLAVSSMMLIACGGNAKESKAAGNTSAEAPVSGEAPASAEVAPSTNVGPIVKDSFTVTFKDTVAAAASDKMDTPLAEFINTNTKSGFVSAITNTSCQIAAVEDVDGNFTVLQVGSGSKGGELNFTFSQTIKSVVLNVTNYNRDYDNNGVKTASDDTSSKLFVNVDTNLIDLSAEKGSPVTKNETVEINGTTLKLYNKAGKNRVFVNSITFNL